MKGEMDKVIDNFKETLTSFDDGFLALVGLIFIVA